MQIVPKKVLLVPLDPVHDVALKIINRRLKERGHKTLLLPPDISIEEIVDQASKVKPDIILISRTLGFLEGYLSHEEDGSIITECNLGRIKESLNNSTLWTVRAHRGLNTPETV